MHANQSTALAQQRAFASLCEQADYTTFFNLLTSDELLEQVEPLLPDHRERLFPPTETLSLFLAQVLSADSSCQGIVNQIAVQRLGFGLPSCSTHTGGYCRARQRLPVEMVRTLAGQVGARLERQAPSDWRWQDRRVLLVDGTTLSMPDSAANQAVFPQQRGQLPGLGFPLCRLVGIIGLASGALLNAAIGPFKGKGSGELSLLRQMLDTFQPGDVVLADALYANYFMIAALTCRGVDVVMEHKARRKRSSDERLRVRDHLRTINKPKRPEWMSEADYQALPASLTVRLCKVGGRTLLTTLNKTTAKGELRVLYQSRWHVELDLRSIKTTMGMSTLSCKTPKMVVKEIWVYLLAYNLIRWVMAEAAVQYRVIPRQLSFKHALQLWLIWLHYPFAQRATLHELLKLVAQQRVGHRPGRIEPRAVKRRPKPHQLLQQPRHEARQLILDFGHPKRLK